MATIITITVIMEKNITAERESGTGRQWSLAVLC